MLHELPFTGNLPEKFTYPFCYQPHPAAVMAAKLLQEYLEGKEEWKEELEKGKMFGVLVVAPQNPPSRGTFHADCSLFNNNSSISDCSLPSKSTFLPHGSLPLEGEDRGGLFFLAAYSGLLAGRNDHEFFVPPVFDSQQPDGYFKTEERRISALSRGGRETRSHSIRLQRWLFSQYNILNVSGESRNLIDIFNEHFAGLKGKVPKEFREGKTNANGQESESYAKSPETRIILPPSGAGDCCAPKLLQYAFQCGLKPVCMAEFWYGNSPKGEVRHHLQFYPACTGKCKPILRHMLKGTEVERNPHETAVMGELETIYSDEYICVVNKPAGMLSVPGNIDAPSVVETLKQRSEATESATLLPVHRLDMATSGLLLIAKSEKAYKTLQSQFARHEVKKEYVAVLQKDIALGEKGRITLPLRRDTDNRPCQKVDYEHGKASLTEYEVIGERRLLLRPLTGRTHQLRVHCAHKDGLDNPIVGDELYGMPGKRLLLHSQRLQFVHPYTNKTMEFINKPNF